MTLHIMNAKKLMMILIFGVGGLAYAGDCPLELRKSLVLLNAQLPRIPSAFRVSIYKLPDSLHVDPLPDEGSFESYSALRLTLNPSIYGDSLLNLVNQLKAASWDSVSPELEGNGKWCLRMYGNWDAIILDLYIDGDRNLIKYKGVWYRVKKELVKAMTSDLSATAFKDMQ